MLWFWLPLFVSFPLVLQSLNVVKKMALIERTKVNTSVSCIMNELSHVGTPLIVVPCPYSLYFQSTVHELMSCTSSVILPLHT